MKDEQIVRKQPTRRVKSHGYEYSHMGASCKDRYINTPTGIQQIAKDNDNTQTVFDKAFTFNDGTNRPATLCKI